MLRLWISNLVVATILGITSGASADSPPIASSPGSRTDGSEVPVVGTCPTFSWGAEEPAAAYEIVVYDLERAEAPVVALSREPASPRLRVTVQGDARSWTPSRSECFEPDALYAWAVRAFDDEAPTNWSDSRLFRVEPMPSKSEVLQALQVLKRFTDQQMAHSEEAGTSSGTAHQSGDVGRPDREDTSSEGTALHSRSASLLDSLRSPSTSRLRPKSVAAPNAPALTIDGNLVLDGFIYSGDNPLLHNDGFNNTGIGTNALVSNDNGVGFDNTAVGSQALTNSTLGIGNTAVGAEALMTSTSASNNTAVGRRALKNNTNGQRNTAVGEHSMEENTSGEDNVAMGWLSLEKNETGRRNVGLGKSALSFNTSGSDNVGVGESALVSNSTGIGNTALGNSALGGNDSGDRNIALGLSAGSDTTGDNNILIGHDGVEGESGTIRIGTSGTHSATFIAAISSNSVSGSTVVVDSNGQLGVSTSSRRFKQDIRDIGEESRKLYELRPVAFQYKEDLVDGDLRPEFGLLAEEAAETFPELVRYDDEGNPLSIRYRVVTPLLLNEIQRQRERLHDQKVKIRDLREELEELESLIQGPGDEKRKQIRHAGQGPLRSTSDSLELDTPTGSP